MPARTPGGLAWLALTARALEGEADAALVEAASVWDPERDGGFASHAGVIIREHLGRVIHAARKERRPRLADPAAVADVPDSPAPRDWRPEVFARLQEMAAPDERRLLAIYYSRRPRSLKRAALEARVSYRRAETIRDTFEFLADRYGDAARRIDDDE